MPIDAIEGGGHVITGSAIILTNHMRLLGAMKLELKTGMKHSKLGSVIAKVKAAEGFKGNKAKVVALYEAKVEALKKEYADDPANGVAKE